MAKDSKVKVYRVSRIEDLKFISGGAKVIENIDDNLLQTSRTHKCNCGEFSPMNLGVSLDICDNCKHARTPSENSNMAFCCKQKI